MGDFVRVNGVAMSWASIGLIIADQRFYGVTEISYGDKIEAPFGYGLGAGYAPRAQTKGKYSTDPVVVKMYKDSAEMVRLALQAQSPTGAYGVAFCQIVVNFNEAVDGLQLPQVHIMERCRLLEEKTSHSESPDVLEEELTFSTFAISRNGKYRFDITRGF